jgi:hypothetical protein
VLNGGGWKLVQNFGWGLLVGRPLGVLLTVQFSLVFFVYPTAVQLDSSDGVTGHFT